MQAVPALGFDKPNPNDKVFDQRFPGFSVPYWWRPLRIFCCNRCSC
jgi:hypothetical protein